MATPEDCRRKAQHWLREAEATSDAHTSAKMRHVSELWTELAEQMQRTSHLTRPRDLVARKVERRAASVEIGDFLRNRLQIGEPDPEFSGEHAALITFLSEVPGSPNKK